MIPLVRQAGFKWMATDEGVLARSLGQWNRQNDSIVPTGRIDRPRPGQDIDGLSRPRDLGRVWICLFKMDAGIGRRGCIASLAAIVDQTAHDHPVIPIILDGENPWEHYYDGGERFLSGLYTRLSSGALDTSARRVSLDTVCHAIEEQPPTTRLTHFHSGSWINSDFKIWIGHPEDNRGWEMLRETRARLVEMEASLTAEQAAARGTRSMPRRAAIGFGGTAMTFIPSTN